MTVRLHLMNTGGGALQVCAELQRHKLNTSERKIENVKSTLHEDSGHVVHDHSIARQRIIS
jgi:hypothetical protein